jgi:hypothetical protein
VSKALLLPISALMDSFSLRKNVTVQRDHPFSRLEANNWPTVRHCSQEVTPVHPPSDVWNEREHVALCRSRSNSFSESYMDFLTRTPASRASYCSYFVDTTCLTCNGEIHQGSRQTRELAADHHRQRCYSLTSIMLDIVSGHASCA